MIETDRGYCHIACRNPKDFFAKSENALTKNLDKYIKKETALY